MNAEEIKKWLKDAGKNRQWLAEKTLTSRRTVDNWLSTGRLIPPAKLALIEKLMTSEEEVRFDLPETFEAMLIKMASDAHKSIDTLVMSILKMTGQAQQKLEKKEVSIQQCTPHATSPASVTLDYATQIIANLATGALTDGDTFPHDICMHRPLEKGEYVLRVNGQSMEPAIMNGTLVVMRKHTVPPVPKIGTIVEYHDERGVSIKKLAQRKTADGKKEYILHSLNPAFPDILPMDGGKISAIYVKTISNTHKA